MTATLEGGSLVPLMRALNLWGGAIQRIAPMLPLLLLQHPR